MKDNELTMKVYEEEAKKAASMYAFDHGKAYSCYLLKYYQGSETWPKFKYFDAGIQQIDSFMLDQAISYPKLAGGNIGWLYSVSGDGTEEEIGIYTCTASGEEGCGSWVCELSRLSNYQMFDLGIYYQKDGNGVVKDVSNKFTKEKEEKKKKLLENIVWQGLDYEKKEKEKKMKQNLNVIPKLAVTSRGTIIESLYESIKPGLDEMEQKNLEILLKLVEERALGTWLRRAMKEQPKSTSVYRWLKSVLDNTERV